MRTTKARAGAGVGRTARLNMLVLLAVAAILQFGGGTPAGAAEVVLGEDILVTPDPSDITNSSKNTYTNNKYSTFPSTGLGSPSTPTPLPSKYGPEDPNNVWGNWPGTANTYAHPTASIFPWNSGEDNRVIIDGATIDHNKAITSTKGYVLGGLWQGRDHGANRNRVYIQNGADAGKVYGGAAIGDVKENIVRVTGGGGRTTYAQQVSGGLSVMMVDPDIGQDPKRYTVRDNRVYVDGSMGAVVLYGTVSDGWNASGGGSSGAIEDGTSDTTVIGNGVEISGDVIIAATAASNPAQVYGGFNEGNNITSGNFVDIKGGNINPTGGADNPSSGTDVRQIVGGFSSISFTTTAHVFDNHVRISGGTITFEGTGNQYNGIYGGRHQGGGVDIYGNTVEISGGTIMMDAGVIAGAGAGNPFNQVSDVRENAVAISGGTITANVAGARVNNAGTGHDNSVSMSAGSVTGNIYGAYDGSDATINATITDNAVSLTGGSVNTGSVYGGLAYGGTASDNTVTLAGATVRDGNVYGGWTDTGAVTANHATLTSGSVGGSAHGGYSNSGEVDSNTLSVGVAVAGDAYGGYSINGKASANELAVTGGGVGGDAFGGYSANADANDNTLTVSGGNVTGDAFGGRSAIGEARANKLTVAGGGLGGEAYGGHAETGDADENALTLAGGTLYGSAYGGWTKAGGAEGNTVAVRGATVNGNVYAGFAEDAPAAAAGNKAELYGGLVKGVVYGNNNPDFADAASWKGQNNTLKAVSGRTDVGGIANFATADINPGAHVNVLGHGRDDSVPDKAVFNDLANRGFLSFHNDTDDQEVGIVHGAYTGSGKIGLDVIFNEGVAPQQTDSIVFRQLPTAPVTFAFNPLAGSVMAAYTKSDLGGAPEADDPNSLFAVSESGSMMSLIRTEEIGYGLYIYEFREEDLGGGKYNYYVGFSGDHSEDIGKIIPDVGGSGLVSVGDMTDTLLGGGLDRAVRSIDVRDAYGISASVEYSDRRYSTGGRSGTANMDGLSGLVTFAWAPRGRSVSYGVFGEFYDGRYATSDTIAIPSGVYGRRSRGDITNYGGGVFLQYRQRLAEAIAADEFAAWTPGLHLEATARLGRSVMDMDLDLEGTSGRTRFSDKGATYYGASLGGGYVAAVNRDLAVDLYGHGAWVRLGGSSVHDENNALGKRIEFKAADSLRIVAGARAAYTGGGRFRPYAGLAAEWEALGRPGARIDGMEAGRADFSGVSGLVELGVGAKLHERLFVDARATGSFGKRKGLAGFLEARYSF